MGHVTESDDRVIRDGFSCGARAGHGVSARRVWRRRVSWRRWRLPWWGGRVSWRVLGGGVSGPRALGGGVSPPAQMWAAGFVSPASGGGGGGGAGGRGRGAAGGF